MRVINTRPLVVNNRGPNRKVTPSNPKGQVNNYQDSEMIIKDMEILKDFDIYYQDSEMIIKDMEILKDFDINYRDSEMITKDLENLEF